MASDLHIHTTYSDGELTPEEVVAAAKKAQLKYIAITDHDTIDGLLHLYEQGMYPGHGINIIPGVEFSTYEDDHDIHLLGYNMDLYDQHLAEVLNSIVESRWQRFSQMVEKLQLLGYNITETDVLKLAGSSTSVSRAHIARALVLKGYFQSVKEVIESVLDRGRQAYVPHYRLKPQEVIDLVHETGGQVVLAHPKLVHDDELVAKILQYGVDGIEVYYPQHSDADTSRYIGMAEKYKIAAAGGSDFHGFPGRYPEEIGVFTIADSCAQKFFRHDSDK